MHDRIKRRNSGQGKYTAKGVPWKLIHTFDCQDRTEAVNLENKIKKRGIKRYLDDYNTDSSGGGAAR
ncbi:MAG: hypothetical protein M3342_04575 [Bacteroidota bacterium]|nr:hypothetical protein [Bacteroidota bacterium]